MALIYGAKRPMPEDMPSPGFDEAGFFHALTVSGARALLVGRRALVALGIPVLTADYDFWLHPDDVEIFNRAAEPFDLVANRSPADARLQGRYVLENDEHIDVLIARHVSLGAGRSISFDEVWQRRRLLVSKGASVPVPSTDDIISTKRWGSRPKDAEDIRLLEALRERERRGKE